MKLEKGITLISLTIYIIVATIVIGIVAVISTYFYKNTNYLSSSINPLTEYTKFNTFFTDEINHENIKILECSNNYIAFDNATQYTFIGENQGIYRNKIKICSNVEKCEFSRTVENGKDVVIVTIQIADAKPRTTHYTLKK